MGCNQSLPAMSCTPRPDDVRDNLSFAEVSEELVHSKYELGLMLGTGGYAQVRAARCVATGTMMAAKVIDLPPRPPPRQRENESLEAGNSVKESGKSDDSFQCEEISSTLEPCPIRANAMREAGMLARLRGVSQVVQLKEVFMTAEHVYIITEKLEGGELFDALLERGSLKEEEVAVCVRSIVQGVKAMHEKNIVHRDLKLENLLVRRRGGLDDIAIADLGLARNCKAGHAVQRVCGSPLYAAPEVLQGGAQGATIPGYGRCVDNWSLGVVTYLLLSGRPPFNGRTNAQLFTQIVRGAFSFKHPMWDSVGDTAKSFIMELLDVDPDTRLSAEDALAHPFLRSAGPGGEIFERYMRTSEHARAARQLSYDLEQLSRSPDNLMESEIRRLEAGEVLIEQGEVATDECYLIRGGTLEVRVMCEGEWATVAMRRRGDVLGVLGALEGLDKESESDDASTSASADSNLQSLASLMDPEASPRKAPQQANGSRVGNVGGVISTPPSRLSSRRKASLRAIEPTEVLCFHVSNLSTGDEDGVSGQAIRRMRRLSAVREQEIDDALAALEDQQRERKARLASMQVAPDKAP